MPVCRGALGGAARQLAASAVSISPWRAAPLAGRQGDEEGENEMNGLRILAIVLIVAGALALAYGGFSYLGETHHATAGPINLSVTERHSVAIPLWAGVAAVVVGGVLLLTPVLRRGR